MRVQNVHELAEPLISLISTPHPFLIWMAVPHEFGHIYHATEHVAELIQVLNNHEELMSGTRSGQDAVR